jgi:hypothetical protein
METNFYKIPTEDEMKARKELLIKRINDMENEKFEQRNYVKPAWQPTEKEMAQEKQIITNEPTPEPAPVTTEGDKTNNE